MVFASQTLVLFGWSIGLQVLVVIGCLLSVISVGILFFVVNAWSEKKQNPSYDWQPELSHNVIENKIWGTQHGGGHLHMTKLPKSQEQLDEEKRAYLKERKSYD